MKKLFIYMMALPAMVLMASCKDTESYADKLTDENHAVNAYLANFPVITSVPADREFVTTADIKQSDEFKAEYGHLKVETQDSMARTLTPFYRMDNEGYVYMQVINPGTGEFAADDQQIWFRFTRWNLNYVYKYGTWEGSGNESDVASEPTSFRYKNTSLYSTTMWGTGIQVPLEYLRLNCEVNLVIKSYLGPVEEVTSVYPYLYSLRYYPSKI